MESFFRPFRHKVSADKNRYQTGDYDLDLTYVSDRVIAMAFPAEGVEVRACLRTFLSGNSPGRLPEDIDFRISVFASARLLE